MHTHGLVILQAGKGKWDTLFHFEYDDAENKRTVYYNVG